MQLINASIDYLKLGFRGGYDDLGTFKTFVGSEENFEQLYQEALNKVRVPLVAGLDLVTKKRDRRLSGYLFYIEAKSDFFFSHSLTELNAMANVVRCDIALDFATKRNFFLDLNNVFNDNNWRFLRMKVVQVGNPRDGITYYLGNSQTVLIRIYDKGKEVQGKKEYLLNYLRAKAPDAKYFVRLEFQFHRNAFRMYGLPEDLSVINVLPCFIETKYALLLNLFGIKKIILDYYAKGSVVHDSGKYFKIFARAVSEIETALKGLEESQSDLVLFDVMDDVVCTLIDIVEDIKERRKFYKGVF